MITAWMHAYLGRWNVLEPNYLHSNPTFAFSVPLVTLSAFCVYSFLVCRWDEHLFRVIFKTGIECTQNSIKNHGQHSVGRLWQNEEKPHQVLLNARNFHQRQEWCSRDFTYITRACLQERGHNYKENFLGVRGGMPYLFLMLLRHKQYLPFSKQHSCKQCALKASWLHLEYAFQSLIY